MNTIILPDGRFFAVYSNVIWNQIYPVHGVAFGQGKNSQGTFTGTYRYTGDLSLHSGTLNASVVPGSSVSGKFSENGIDLNFIGDVMPSIYTYDTPASMSSVVGQWGGEMLGGYLPTSITVSGDGTITGRGVSNVGAGPACNFTGSISPDSQKNFYGITLKFGDDPCPLPNQTATGVAIIYKNPYLSLSEITIAFSAGDSASAFIGTPFP